MSEPKPPSPFHKIIALHEQEALDWSTASRQAPQLTRGWYELSRLPTTDRIEFTRDYWLAKLPILSPKEIYLEEHLIDFFGQLNEIGIFLAQERSESPFEVYMVYSLRDEMGFFQGGPPATDEVLRSLQAQFANITFPPDYLAFLEIHNGFSKYTDTGLFPIHHLPRIYQQLQQRLYEEILVSPDGQIINPAELIPFYESYGLHCFQCFYSSWHPEEEMGNVFFSAEDNSMSNFLDREHLKENLAFTTFLAWLVSYLEDLPRVS